MKAQWLAVALLSGGALAQQGAGKPQGSAQGQGERTAQARFVDAQGKEVGRATLREVAHGVIVSADFSGLPPGEHAFHVHEKGVCEPPFTSAGGHFNPLKKQHGIANPKGLHAGDMPNLTVPQDGKLHTEVFLEGLTLSKGSRSLLDKDGSALMVHAKGDDYRTDPTGGAGDRIACAVVEGQPAPTSP